MVPFMEDTPFDPIEDAIRDIAAGKMVIVTDDEDRENEGDLIMAASKVTPEAINTMLRYCSGIICVPMLTPQLKRLGIQRMVAENREVHRTDFTVSVDAAEGITTGISAFDRAETIRLLADPKSTPDQLVQPGHVFPLRAQAGGVLQRAGHTEASVDLAQLAGLHPSGVLCELMNDDGTVARLPRLIEYKKQFGLKLVSIADLIEYRRRREQLVSLVVRLDIESEWGNFTLHVFKSALDERYHYALSQGVLGEEPTLVRVQRQNLLSDVFGVHGNGAASFRDGMQHVANAGGGVVVYIAHSQGGLRVEEGEISIKAGAMDLREYGLGAQILSFLGLKKIRLLTATPRNVVALEGYNLEIVEHVSFS